MEKVPVLLATPFGRGGPQRWAQEMDQALRDEVQFTHVNSWRRLHHLMDKDPRIIHTTLPFVRTRKPLLVTVKGNFVQEARIYRRGYHALIRRADRLTVPSEFLRTTLGLDDAQVIPNAIHDKGAVWRPHEAPVLRILVASNFSFPAKAQGSADLIAALGLVARTRPGSIEVSVAGQGVHAERVRQAVQQAGPGFRFLGWVEDLRGLFADHDVLIYRSYLDNQPNLLIEAMLAGIPVLANGVGDVPSMVPAACRLDDLSDLRDALDRVTDPQQRARLSTAGRDHALARFTWERVKPLWLNEYQRLLE